MNRVAPTELNQLVKRSFDAFGTVVSLKAYFPDNAAEEAFMAFKEECERYERLFSAFDSQSDVGRINNAQGAWVNVDEETYELITLAKRYCERSWGLFDITVKPLVDLWDVHVGKVPPDELVEEARTHVDYRAIELESTGAQYRVRLADPQAKIDLGGVAKGYIADKLGKLLQSRGVENYVMSLGGNVLTHGVKSDGSRFVVGVRDPNDHSRVVGTLELHDASAVASGVSERFFEHDGTTYSHIIDPHTGKPVVSDVKSVTLVARKSVDCDGLSTTLCALGMDAGMRAFWDIDELEMALFVSVSGELGYCTKERTQDVIFHKYNG